MKIEEELHPESGHKCSNNDHEDVPDTPRHHTYLKPKGSYAPPAERKVELFARIKKSSQYYHQGLDHDDAPQLFKVEGIRQGFLCFRLNDNNYASRDLAFYVRDAGGGLIPLAGGMDNG
jgi:hypothetical protein